MNQSIFEFSADKCNRDVTSWSAWPVCRRALRIEMSLDVRFEKLLGQQGRHEGAQDDDSDENRVLTAVDHAVGEAEEGGDSTKS